MKESMKFPIRLKLMLLMSALIATAIGAYLALALRLFKQDKTELIYELNLSNVRTLAAEVQAEISKVTDKILLLTQGHRQREWIEALVGSDSSLISFTLFRTSGQQWKEIYRYRNIPDLKMMDIPPSDYDKKRSSDPVPFLEILSQRTVVRNISRDGMPPLLSVAVAIQPEGEAVPLVAVADIQMARILGLFAETGVANLYLVSSDGVLVAHPDARKLIARTNLKDSPIVAGALSGPASARVLKFEHDGETWLGASAPVAGLGLHVISQVSSDEVFNAAWKLAVKSALLAVMLLTFALLVTGFLSRSLTRPIERLVHATANVAKWNFEQPVEVKTHDEIGALTHAFNSMAADLHLQRVQIDAHQAELEQKVKDRTAALEDEKRKTAETHDMLLRTTRLASLGELAGVAAHEVLNPVNNMNIRLEKLRRDLGSGEKNDLQLMVDIVAAWKRAYASGGWEKIKEEFLRPSQASPGKTLLEEDLENLEGIVRDGASRLKNRVQDYQFVSDEIVRVSKIVNNMRMLARVKGDRRKFDVHEAIEETLSAVSHVLEKYGVQVEKRWNADRTPAGFVFADKDELVQVFSNLIRNSVQAIDDVRKVGEGRIAITTETREGKVEVRISDNGPGVALELKEKVFEPNFTTKSVEEGTGLGLSISRRLIRAFDGDLILEQSVPGSGVTFLIWLPLLKE